MSSKCCQGVAEELSKNAAIDVEKKEENSNGREKMRSTDG